ncbi:MAG: hypothetical protein K2R98_00285 [Gemmataceae bacterium]|nr:hypothetical protein [Gemmataceae bacterium]
MKSLVVALGIVVGLGALILSKYPMERRASTSNAVAGGDAKTSPVALPADARTEPVVKLVSQVDDREPRWKVVSKWQVTKQDAFESAIAAAQAEIMDYMRGQNQPLELTPPRDLVRSCAKVDKNTEESRNFGPGVGEMHRVTVEVTLSDHGRQTLQAKDREFRVQQNQVAREVRSQERLIFLAKLVAGLVAVLGATACYFRMEDMTKGYYTGWLRLAAAGFVGAVAVVLLLLS